MGAGKTEKTINFLKHCDNFIWITPNTALSANTYTRMKDENIDIKHYQKDFKTREDKQKINDTNKLIICLNSLKFLTTKNYDTIVIDEQETFFNKWFNNETLKISGGSLHLELWDIFKRLIKNARNVIF